MGSNTPLKQWFESYLKEWTISTDTIQELWSQGYDSPWIVECLSLDDLSRMATILAVSQTDTELFKNALWCLSECTKSLWKEDKQHYFTVLELVDQLKFRMPVNSHPLTHYHPLWKQAEIILSAVLSNFLMHSTFHSILKCDLISDASHYQILRNHYEYSCFIHPSHTKWQSDVKWVLSFRCLLCAGSSRHTPILITTTSLATNTNQWDVKSALTLGRDRVWRHFHLHHSK